MYFKDLGYLGSELKKEKIYLLLALGPLWEQLELLYVLQTPSDELKPFPPQTHSIRSRNFSPQLQDLLQKLLSKK